MEGRAARATAEQGNSEEVEASSSAEKGAVIENNQGTESKIGANQKAWLTGESSLGKVGFR